jgi:hypothetical protein
VTAARDARADAEVGCVLAREVGVLVVLTDEGPVRASYRPAPRALATVLPLRGRLVRGGVVD